MNLVKKNWVYFLIIGVIIIIGIILFIILNGVSKSVQNKRWYIYAKENSIMIYDKKTNQKRKLSNNCFDDADEEYIYNTSLIYKLSADNRKIVFSDKITDNSYNLNYIDIKDLSNEDLTGTLIATSVTSSQITKDGIIYNKDETLYYYDYTKTEKVAENIEDFILLQDLNIIFYRTNDDNLYSVEINEKLESKKIANKILYMAPYKNDILYLKQEKNSFTYELYIGDEMIDENVINIINASLKDEELYYANYDGQIDFSSNNSLEIKSLSEAKESNGKIFLIIGSSNCSYTKELLENIEKLNENYNFVYNYIDLNSLTDSEWYDLMYELDYEVNSTPTILVFENGEIVYENLGYTSEILDILYEYNLLSYDNIDEELDYSKITTYKYNGESKTKIFDGLMHLPYEDLDNISYTIATKYLSSNEEELSVLNIKTLDSYDIDLKYQDIEFLDVYNNQLYYLKNDKFYRANIENEQLTSEKELSNNSCYHYFDANENWTYYFEFCDNFDGELYLYEDGVDKLISDNVTNIMGEEKIYYTQENGDTNDLYLYDGKNILIDSKIDYAYYIGETLFYLKDQYTSTKDEKKLADLYLYNDNKTYIVDNDILSDFAIVEIEM